MMLGFLAPAQAVPGIAARFGAARAVAGEDVIVRVEVDDGLGVVKKVRVLMRVRGREGEHAAMAERAGEPGWWAARFDRALVPTPPAWLELRAELLGERSGLLLAIGEDEPHEIPVVTAARAAEESRIFGAARAAEAPLPVAGYVGAEARAGTNARARVVLGAAVRLDGPLELAAGVSVGPTFAEPALFSGGGPMVIGFEAALRGYAGALGIVTPYAEGFFAGDLRLPGFDPGAGLRAGVAWRVGEATGVDLSVGGAVVAYGAFGGPPDDAEVGFTGGVRAAFRFGEPGAGRPAP